MSQVEIQSMWERHTARRRFSHLAGTEVCRNLFGHFDHEELDCEMNRRRQEISEQDQARWNFNFEQDVPLPGHYEWEEITVNVPACYKESVRNGKARDANPRDAESSAVCGFKNEAQSSAQAPTPSAEVNQESRSGTLNARGPGTSTHITDFFPRRKRNCESKQTDRTSQSSIPAEVTPRKSIRC